MENTEKFVEEIKKQLLNVKLMGRDDIRNLNYKKPEEENPFFIEYYDPAKDKTYVKMIEFKYGYAYNGGYTAHAICEVKRWRKPEISEMEIEFDNDGYFTISGVYISFEYCGKIDINF